MGSRYISFARLVSAVLLCASACGCGVIKSLIDSTGSSSKKSAAVPTDDLAVYDDTSIPKIRPGVALTVQVGAPSQKPAEMRVQVDQNGEITLPYLLEKSVQCDGLTLDALKQKLVKEYQTYIRQPVVSLQFNMDGGSSSVSPYGTVLVLGEVSSPGPVNLPATRDMTVTKVIKLAGGLKAFANKSSIRVTSCDKEGNKTVTIVNLNEIGKRGDIEKDIALHAGDVVWVPEQWY